MFPVSQRLRRFALACGVGFGLMVSAAMAAPVSITGHVTRVISSGIAGRTVVVIEDQFGNPFFLILPWGYQEYVSQMVAEARSFFNEQWKVTYNSANRTITSLDTDP